MTQVRVSGKTAPNVQKPAPATQQEVNDGVVENKYVSPKTLDDWTGGLSTVTTDGVTIQGDGGAESPVAVKSGVFASSSQGAKADTALQPINITGGYGVLADAATITWNAATIGNTAKVTLAGNRTLAAITNPVVGAHYHIQITQDGVGGRSLTFNASYIFHQFPYIRTKPNSVTILTFFYNGASFVNAPRHRATDVYPEDFGYDVATNDTERTAAVQAWFDYLASSGAVVGRTYSRKVYTFGAIVCSQAQYLIESFGIFKPIAGFTGVLITLPLDQGSSARSNIRMRLDGNLENCDGLVVSGGASSATGHIVAVNFNQKIAVAFEGNFEKNHVYCEVSSNKIGVENRTDSSGNTPDENHYHIQSGINRTAFRQSGIGVPSCEVHIDSGSGGQDYILDIQTGRIKIDGYVRGADKTLFIGTDVVIFDVKLMLSHPGADLVDPTNTPHMIVDNNNGAGFIEINAVNPESGIWIKKVGGSSPTTLKLIQHDTAAGYGLRLGAAGEAKTLGNFILEQGSRVRGAVRGIFLDNCVGAQLFGKDYGATGGEISSTSNANYIETGTHTNPFTNNRVEKDNIIFIRKQVSDAELAAIPSPIKGHRLLGRTTTYGQWYYDETAVAWVTEEKQTNKSSDTKLGRTTPSSTLYPNQAAVKGYSDNETLLLLETLGFHDRVVADGGKPEGMLSLFTVVKRVREFISPSFMVTGNGWKNAKVHSIYPTSGRGDLTLARSTVRTRVNERGLVESMAIDDPGIVHSSNVAMLDIEPTKQNLKISSQSFTNLNGGVATLNAAESPQSPGGVINATSILFGASTNDGASYIPSGIAVSDSLKYTISFWAKKGSVGNGVMRLRLDSNLTNSIISQNFNTTDEWQKFYTTVQPDAGATSFPTSSRIIPNTNTNGEVLIWGMQIEQAQEPTSLILTSGSVLTRDPDVITALTSKPGLIGLTQGTIYFEGYAVPNGTEKMISISDGTLDNRITFGFGSDNRIKVALVQGGVTGAAISMGSDFLANTLYRIAIIYNNNLLQLIINGVKIGEDLALTVPSCSRIGFDSGDGSNLFYGKVIAFGMSKTAISETNALLLTI
jgi:hypothetical protein